MAKSKDTTDYSLDTRSFQKVESKIQAKIDSGYAAPKGWLFRGLTFLFFTPEHHAKKDHSDIGSDSAKMEDTRQIVACNTARFAAAKMATSLQDRDITHVIVNPKNTSSADVASLRKALAGRSGKLAHVVSCGWVEESWEHGTLLDEESEFCLLSPLVLFIWYYCE